MNTERQTYSDNEIDEYELKRYKFRKRKNSKSKNRDTIHPVVKKCKICKKYMHDIVKNRGLCGPCLNNDNRDSKIFIMFDWLDFLFAILFALPIFFLIPYLIKLRIDELYSQQKTYNITIIGDKKEEVEAYFKFLDKLVPFMFCGAIVAYMFIYNFVMSVIQFFIFHCIFCPILNYKYGYDTKMIEDAIKRKKPQRTLYA